MGGEGGRECGKGVGGTEWWRRCAIKGGEKRVREEAREGGKADLLINQTEEGVYRVPEQ